MNVSADHTGQYLVVSDINNRAIYVLKLQKYYNFSLILTLFSKGNISRNEKEQLISVSTLAHFLVPAPFLSFHILEAGTKLVPCSYNHSTEDLYDTEEDLDDEMELCVGLLKIKFNLQLNTFNILGSEFEDVGYPTKEISRM